MGSWWGGVSEKEYGSLREENGMNWQELEQVERALLVPTGFASVEGVLLEQQVPLFN